MSQAIRLTKPQSKFFVSKAKATAFVGGFGSGKSEGLFTRMLATKLKFPSNDLGYFAPSYSLIRDIAYPRMEEILNNTSLNWILNKSENVIRIKQHGKILFRTMDNPAKIVGFEIKDAFVDELDTLAFHNAKEAWEKILARTRQRAKASIDIGCPENQLFVGTTPEGRRFVWKMWEDTPPPNYKLIRAPTSSNPYLPDDYVDTLLASYPPQLVEAYLMGLFVNLNGSTVYCSYDRILNRTRRKILPNEVLHIGIDFNVMNMSAIVHVKNKYGHPRAVKEHTKLRDTLQLVEDVLIPYKYAGHTVYLYPDASGKSRRTIDASKSDLRILSDNGFILRVPKGNPPVKDRVVTMNTMFCDARKRRRYLVNDEECSGYSSALETQVFLSNGNPEKDPSNNVDDLNDAAGYFIHNQYHVDRMQFTSSHVASY